MSLAANLRSAYAGDRKSKLIERARGALLGSAIGDALGATVEFMQPTEVRARYGVHSRIIGGGWLYLKPGQVTDDTEMSLALARAIVRVGRFDPEAAAGALVEWYRTNPADIGSTCLAGIRHYMHTGETEVRQSPGHGGNGAAMRMGPVAVASYPSHTLLEQWTLGQARLTHNHVLSDAACLAVGEMVHSSLGGGTIWCLRQIADRLVSSHREFRFEPYDGKASGYIAETMATVFHFLFETNSFENCLVGVVNRGQDADTTGAIAGLIAGAHYGYEALPRKWLGRLDGRVREELNRLAEQLIDIGAGTS